MMCSLRAALVAPVLAGTVALAAAHASAPAGAVIRNQAEATYFDPAQDRSFGVTSTIATVRVRPAPAFELRNEFTIESAPNTSVSFPHELQNTGNTPDSYDVSVWTPEAGLALTGISVILDGNQNGLIDPGETAITTTPVLAPGETISMIVSANVPNIPPSDNTYTLELVGVSAADPSLTQRRVDAVSIATNPGFRISKNAFPVCSQPVAGGETIAYQISLLELGGLSDGPREINLAGEVRRGVLIEDPIPANTVLVAGEQLDIAPATAIAVVRDAAAPSDTVSLYSNYREGDLIQSVGLFIPEAALTDRQSGGFEFSVRVNEQITPGTVVTNSIAVDADGDGAADTFSNQTCNQLAASGDSPLALLRFLEPAGPLRVGLSSGDISSIDVVNAASLVDAAVYALDTKPNYLLTRDGVYLEVISTSLNSSAFVSDTTFEQRFIRVEVQSALTGDTLFVQLAETGPNTGVFRAQQPFRLSVDELGQGRDCGPASPEFCVLRSGSGDELLATIFDPGTSGQLIDEAVVDPLGVVFNSATLAPVAGAEVTLRRPGGAVALDPDTGVPVPVQVTGADGIYTIPRLGPGQIYVDIVPPTELSFPSVVEPDVFAGRRDVDQRSYGFDGPLGISGSGLFLTDFSNVPPVIDIPLDPDFTQGQLALVKAADAEVVSFGETVGYTLRLTNNTGVVLLDAEIMDAFPPGFRILDASVTLDNDPLELIRGQGRVVRFPIGRLEIGQTVTVSYRAQVGPDTPAGELVNLAQAEAVTGGGLPAISPRASETVRVSDTGLFSDRAYLIGEVWADADGDGKRDDKEIGLPGARIWLDDGTWVETDELGRYSLFGLLPGQRVARLDDVTLPLGYAPADRSSRHASGGRARFVDLLAGELHRADFPLNCPADTECGQFSAFADLAAARAARQSPDAVLDQALAFEGLIARTAGNNRARIREQVGPDGSLSSGRLRAGAPGGGVADAPVSTLALQSTDRTVPDLSSPDPEDVATTLGAVDVRAGEWLWPLTDPDTGLTLDRDGRFLAAIRAGLTPTLYVDDVAVDTARLGALIENREAGAQVAAWYGVALSPGTHQLEIRGTDPFGNERVLASQTVVRAGTASALRLEAPLVRPAADGHAVADIIVRVLDADDVPAAGAHFVTLFAEREETGEPVRFAGEDVQPDTPGFQTRLRHGVAQIGIVSPETAGRVLVRANIDETLGDDIEIEFATATRDLIAVGLVDISGSIFDVNGGLTPADPGEFPEVFDVDARSSLFLKGRIRGDALLTFAYDTDKNSDDGLFRDIDPEQFYPVYGDASEKGFEAQTRSKVFVRIEKGAVSAQWGDFRSDAFVDESLTQVRRAFTGLNARYAGQAVSAEIFAAQTRSASRTERFAARGTALEFVLPGAPIVPNSEVLTVETRDRNNPGLIVEEVSLTRFVDFLLDDETGQLTLKDPIPSVDDQGNPNFLRASYETLAEDADGAFVGARAEGRFGQTAIRATANVDVSDLDVDLRASGGLAVTQDFGFGQISAEVARMRTELEGGDVIRGNAVRVTSALRVGARGELNADFAQADTGFDNPDARILAGRREARLELAQSLTTRTRLLAGATYSEDRATGSTRTIAQLGADIGLGQWRFAGGPRYTNDSANTDDTAFASVVGRAERALTLAGRPATVFAEVEQNVSGDGTRLVLGSDVIVRSDTRLYANHRLIDDLPDQTFAAGLSASQSSVGQGRTLIGVETSFIPSTALYGEFREAGALDSRTGEAVYGVRAEWELIDGLSIAPQFENVHTFDDDTADGAGALGDSTAISLAIADRRSNSARRTARLETRFSDASTFYGIRAGWAQRFTPHVTGATKIDIIRDNVQNGPDRERIALTAGVARRPADQGKTDVLGVYQYLTEQDGAVPRVAHLVSAHANRRIGTDWVVSGRVASKWENFAALDTSAQIVSGRVIRHFAERWDAELRGGWRAVNFGEANEFNVGTAVSWRAQDNIRLTLGYNFGGFNDRDLDPGSFSANGVFWAINVVLDEDWFGWLRFNGDRAS